MTLIGPVIGLVGLLFAAFFGYRLYRWEKILARARVKVYFKNRTAMTPRLLDLVQWANKVQDDKNVNGQVIYKQGGTTIAITKAHKYVRKPRNKTVKETPRWPILKSVSRRISRRSNGAHSKTSPTSKTPH